MVINIAFGVMLGFMFLGIAVVVICLISAVIIRAQDKIREIPDRPIRHRIRPERSKYEEMQRIKTKAKENNPEHWKEDDRW